MQFYKKVSLPPYQFKFFLTARHREAQRIYYVYNSAEAISELCNVLENSITNR